MSNYGGKRPGAGRKKGSKSATTIEKERVLAEIRQRIMQNAQRILDAQLSKGLGQQFLFKIEKEVIVGPKGGKTYHNKRPEMVTDPDEIRAYLDGLVENGDMDDSSDPEATYYFITTKEPDNMAIDSMLNRTFGKPTENIDIKSDGKSISPDIKTYVVVDKALNSFLGNAGKKP